MKMIFTKPNIRNNREETTILSIQAMRQSVHQAIATKNRKKLAQFQISIDTYFLPAMLTTPKIVAERDKLGKRY